MEPETRRKKDFENLCEEFNHPRTTKARLMDLKLLIEDHPLDVEEKIKILQEHKIQFVEVSASGKFYEPEELLKPKHSQIEDSEEEDDDNEEFHKKPEH